MTKTLFPPFPAISFNRIAFKLKRTLALAMALIIWGCVSTDIAAQYIFAPASSAGTSLRATVGINLSNYATQSQVSNVDSRVTNVDSRVTNVDNRVTTVDGRVTNVDGRVTTVDGRVTNVDGRVTNVDNRVTTVDGRVTTIDGRVTTIDGRVTTIDGRVTAIQSSSQSLAWTRYFVGQMRRITGYYGDNTDVHIQQDGMLYWTYSNPPQGISNAHLGSAYAGYGDRVVIQNASGTWAANMFFVYTGGHSVSVAPVSYGPNGVPTNWGISINVPSVDNGSGNGGGADF
jgi:hypothetical protein